jgi:transposase
MEVITIGLDLAKNVFAVHGVDPAGRVVVRKELRRSQVLPFFSKLAPSVIGMEASNGAHYWGRELRKLGHDPKLMPASYVKSYVKRNKTDAIDAAANCEAVSRPTMRFVPIKSVAQQGLLTLHRSRDLLVGQRTQITNALRSFCAEFGVIAAKGRMPLEQLLALVENPSDERLPTTARIALTPLVAQHKLLSCNIAALEREIGLRQACDEQRRLMTIPGIGVLTASALLATIGDVKRFASGRDLAAWIGLTPRAHSTGGKSVLLSITKMGDQYLRKLLVQGAMSLIRCAQTSKTAIAAWLRQMLARKPKKLVALALANKLARIAWAILAKGGTYSHPISALQAVP